MTGYVTCTSKTYEGVNMIADNGMSVITVKKDGLLETLRKNREDHRGTFIKAQEGYRVSVIEELDSMLKDAREGKNYRKVVQLTEPQDHTRDYDRIIRMLEMSIDETIKITESEFNQYVMDDWGWKQQFAATSAVYVGKAGR